MNGRSRLRSASRSALAEVGLGSLAQRELATLSGGEQRRAAIARLLVQAPSIYLLDEPTNHLDPAQQLGILELCATLTRAGAAVHREPARPESRAAFRGSRWLLSGAGMQNVECDGARTPGTSAGSTARGMPKRAWVSSVSWRRTSHARSR